jgi:hypothetical protein
MIFVNRGEVGVQVWRGDYMPLAVWGAYWF